MQLYIYNGQSTNYAITTEGLLLNTKTNKYLKGQTQKNGYKTYIITLSDGSRKRLYAHRMVMMTFKPVEGMEDLEVNHIDGNKQNNDISNLEWVTSQQNKQHALQTGLYDSKLKKIYCFDKEKNLVGEFDSIVTAVKLQKVSHSGLSNALNHDKATLFNGHYWRFSPDPNFEIYTSENKGEKKRVGKFSLDGDFIESYDSIAEAAEAHGIFRSNISKCCNGHIRTYKGFIWQFI